MARRSAPLSFALDLAAHDLVLRGRELRGRSLEEHIADDAKAVDPRVVALFERQRTSKAPVYKSPEWHAARVARIGGSEVAALVGKNKYERIDRLWRKRTGQLPRDYGVSQFMVSWGTRLEDEAMQVYAALTGCQYVTDNLGSVVHPDHDFVAATPDFITIAGILVEIKCPRTRAIGHFCPENYYPQLQLQLAVTGLDVCHFVQYKPPYLDAPGELDVLVVRADPAWFASVLEPCRVFVAAVVRFYALLAADAAEPVVPGSDVRSLPRTAVARAQAECFPAVKRVSEWAEAFVEGAPDPPPVHDAPDVEPRDEPGAVALWMRTTSDIPVLAN